MCLPAWPPGERLYTCFRNEAVAAPAGPRDGETPQPAVSKVKKGRQGLALSPPKGETCHAGTAPNTPTPEPRAPLRLSLPRWRVEMLLTQVAQQAF
jgi:hypothetical protein